MLESAMQRPFFTNLYKYDEQDEPDFNVDYFDVSACTAFLGLKYSALEPLTEAMKTESRPRILLTHRGGGAEAAFCSAPYGV